MNKKEKFSQSNKEVNIIKTKHYPSSVREWNSSIYVFNKNVINLIPTASELSIKLIKSYFNIYNYKLEQKIRRKRLLKRLRKLSSHKIYVSNGEFKHTNNKVLITIYLFNRQKYNYLVKMRTQYYKKFMFFKNKLKNKIFIIKYKGLGKINKFLIMKNQNRLPFKQSINLTKYLTNFYKKFIKKTLLKLKIYLYYKQLLHINKSKYSYIYLQYLNKHLKRVFNKNVEFNLVNIKKFYLNSDIFSESIALKLAKNRRKILKYLNIIKKKVKTRNWLLQKKILNEERRYLVLNNLKYKHVTGFRLEAKGRLSKRYTASRSISKLRYKGNLMNIDSSFKGLSSVILKGNLRSNVQHTKLNSKTRIGSFGIKGWISGN